MIAVMIMLMISMTNTNKKQLHSYAHKMLREAMKLRNVNYTEDTPITQNKMGKPSLADRPDIHYNLSHAEGIAACMISDFECGIDCEKVRDFRPNVVKRVFSENEKAMFEDTPDSEKALLFFRLWTLKEAYVKAIGVGISYPMNEAEFSFSGTDIVTNIENCRFRQYIIGEKRFVVSVCEIIKQN